MRRSLVSLFVVAACGSSTPQAKDPPPPLPPDHPVATPTPAPAPTPTPMASKAASCDDLPAAVDKVVQGELAKVPDDQRAAAEQQVAQAMPQIKSAMVGACKSDGWSPEAIACMANGTSADDWGVCGAKLSEAQQKSLQARLSPPPKPASAYDLAPNLGVAECDDFLKAIDRAVQCDKLDDTQRDGIRSAAADQKKTWAAMPHKTAADKQALVDSCKKSMIALKDAASSVGCGT